MLKRVLPGAVIYFRPNASRRSRTIMHLNWKIYGADGGLRATIPGTYWTAKMDRRDKKLGNLVGDVTATNLPCDAPSWEPQARIPYLWIFDGAPKEEVGF